MADKKIDDLFPDIDKLLKGENITPDLGNPAHYLDFAGSTSNAVFRNVNPRDRGKREPNLIYASELGTNCVRKLRYQMNSPELAEGHGLSTRVKFMYGDMIESMVLLLAKLAGHKVEGEQEVIEHTTPGGVKIRGRQDAIVDGVTVDVKSTTPFGFKKMVNKHSWEDPFGYQWQLSFYDIHGTNFSESSGFGRFLLVEKTSGKLGWAYRNRTIEASDIEVVADQHLERVGNGKELPRLVTAPHARGATLGVSCSYCPFKRHCWKDSNGGVGLRTFLFHDGPKFFTEVTSIDAKFLSREVPNEAEEEEEPELSV